MKNANYTDEFRKLRCRELNKLAKRIRQYPDGKRPECLVLECDKQLWDLAAAAMAKARGRKKKAEGKP